MESKLRRGMKLGMKRVGKGIPALGQKRTKQAIDIGRAAAEKVRRRVIER